MQTILVVDAQTAVLESCWRPGSLVAGLNAVVSEGRRREIPVVFVQHTDPSGELAENARGWALHRDLDARPTDRFVTKSATDSFYRSDLATILADLGAETLIVGGAASDYCIDATVRAAQSLGFDVDLLADGHTTQQGASGLAAPQIISHINEILELARHPGGRVRLVPCSEAFE